MPTPNPRLPPQQHALAAALYAALAVWLTWPQAALLGSAIVGGPIGHIDGWQKVWNMWWIRTALENGQNPFYTRLLYWPLELPLGLQPIDMTSAALSLPVLLLAGPVAAYGVAALLNFTLSGWISYLLALRVTGSLPGALLAGVIVAAAPQHLVRFLDGQLEHVAIQWVALALLALVHTSEHPTWRAGIWLAGSMLLVCYTSWYHAFFLALATLTWLLWLLARTHRLWPLLRPWLVALPLLLVGLLPILPGLFSGLANAARSADHWRTQAAFYSVDLLDLLLPSANHPLWGAAVRSYQQQFHPNSASWVTTPGYVALLLALLACGVLLWRRCRRREPVPPALPGLALAAGVLWLFALGTRLHVGGVDTGIPLPVAQLFAALPGTSFAFRRQLAALTGMLPLAVLAAFGLHVVLAGRSGWQRRVLFGALAGVLLFELAPPPMQVYRDDTPPVYARLRSQPGTLLVVPIRPRSLATMSSSLRAQMTHQRPIIGGYVARPPDYPMGRSAPLLRRLDSLDCEREYIGPDDQATARSALAFYEIRQIVLHSERLDTRRQTCARQTIERFLGLSPSLESGTIRVYDVPPFQPQPFLYLDRGWYDLERNDARRWRWMSTRGTLQIVNPDDAPRQMVVTLRLESFHTARPVHIALADQQVGTIQVQPGLARPYHLLLTVPPGEHTLHVSAPASEDPMAGRRVSIVLVAANLEGIGGS